MKKITSQLLVIICIILFVDVIIAPGLRPEKKYKLYTISAKIYGFKGIEKSTIQLTEKQKNNLDHIFNSNQQQLSQVVTNEDTIRIYQTTLSELNKFKLFPPDSYQQFTRRMITHMKLYFQISDTLKKINQNSKDILNDNENRLCSVSGRTNITSFESRGTVLSYYLMSLVNFGLSYISLFFLHISKFVFNTQPNSTILSN
jgi:hypothetical protein